MEMIDTINARAACVKAMRPEDVDEAEQAMLNELTNVTKKYKALGALGDFTTSLSVHHDAGPSAAGGVDSNSKNAVSFPNVIRQPSSAFNKVRQNDELASCAARRGRGAREVRSADVDEVEQAMLDQLTHVLRNTRQARSSVTRARTCPSLSVHHDNTPRAAGAVQHGHRFNDFDIKPPTDLQHNRRLREPTLLFKVHTLPAPDSASLNDTVQWTVYRTTPIPKRKAPREKDTMQGAPFGSPRFGEKAAEPDGLTSEFTSTSKFPTELPTGTHRTWEGRRVVPFSRFLQASHKAETCVWLTWRCRVSVRK